MTTRTAAAELQAPAKKKAARKGRPPKPVDKEAIRSEIADLKQSRKEQMNAKKALAAELRAVEKDYKAKKRVLEKDITAANRHIDKIDKQVEKLRSKLAG